LGAGARPSRRNGRAAALLLTLGALAALSAPPAQATTVAPVWQCRASALWASLTGNNRVEPILANGSPNTANGASADRPQCASDEAGLGNLATPLGLPPDLITAKTASAITAIAPDLGNPIEQSVTSSGKIEDLTLQLPPGGSGLVLGVQLATADATASCAGGTPKLSGTSEVAGLSVNGQGGSLDQVLQQLSDALQPLGMLITIKVNEQIKDAGSLTQRALHISIINQQGQAPVLDVVLGEAKVAANGEVCNSQKQPCPAGYGLDSTLKCVPVVGSQTLSQVVEAVKSHSNPLNGQNGSTCAHRTMYFDRNRRQTFSTRFGTRVVTRGRLVNCKGKSIIGAKIDVVHIVDGKRHLLKTGMKSRGGGRLTLILPLNLTTRSVEFDYRAHLTSRRVTSRRTLRLTVLDRYGRSVTLSERRSLQRH
jgi:hypothetical protein